MLSELRRALAVLCKSPGFFVVTVLTLALGIGATTAIFTVLNAVLLKPLPYTQPEGLARIYTEFPTLVEGGLQRFGVSKSEYLSLRRESRSWLSIDAWSNSGVNIASAAQPVRVTASFVTGGTLRSLGVTPHLGRSLNAQDDVPGETLVANISYNLWQNAFGGERSIVGREIQLNGRKCTVVGVMPRDFQFPPGEADPPQVWVPLQIDPANLGDSSNHILSVFGRLRPGVTLHQARSELSTLVRNGIGEMSSHRLDPKFHPVVAYGLHEEVVRTVRPALQILSGAVLFLLLIACVNVANLILTRVESRQREIAIRGALGAGVWQLARQFLAEGLILSIAGATVGLALAAAGVRLLELVGADAIPRAAEVAINGSAILFAIAASAITALAFGLAPLIHVSRKGLHAAMKSAAASVTDTATTQRFRQVLVVSQLALALILLTGTALMLRAFWNAREADAGFNPQGVVTMVLALPDAIYSDQTARSFWTRLDQRAAAIPGVRNVALTSSLPPMNRANYAGTEIEDLAPGKEGPFRTVDYFQFVSRDYFSALGIRLLEGRLLEPRDFAGTSTAVVINHTMAQMFWPQTSPVGRRVRPYSSDQWLTVIGVIADVKNAGVASPTGSAIYFPFTTPLARSDIFGYLLKTVNIAVRSNDHASHIVGALRRAISELDPALPVTKIRTMDQMMSDAQSRPRFLTVLLTLFASVAVTLAAVGIYGVISYSVTQRTREFGIRMALGAQRSSVLTSVLRRGLMLVTLGVLIGVLGAFFLTRFLQSFLFGITASDPTTFAGVALLMIAIAMIASYVPARRATRVDPLAALRAE